MKNKKTEIIIYIALIVSMIMSVVNWSDNRSQNDLLFKTIDSSVSHAKTLVAHSDLIGGIQDAVITNQKALIRLAN